MQIIVLFKKIQKEIEKHHQHSRFFKKNIKSKDMQMKHAVQQKSSP